jgi:energy-coupling factor transporter ATP-binding protein EcfA2
MTETSFNPPPAGVTAPGRLPYGTPRLEVHELRVAYGRRVAVDGISFVIQPGEIFGLLGPNGAGKTSTLSAIEGLLVPVGIRLALGTRPQDVRRRLLAEGVQLAVIGAALGLGITALGGRMIASLLYGVTQTHAPTLLLAGVIMAGVGALASLGPAERAARMSPASALQSE